jgi:hypothetical protein
MPQTKPKHRSNALFSESREQPGSVSHSFYVGASTMKCSELQYILPLYGDDDTSDKIDQHLAACPLCRQKKADYSEIRVGLRKMGRPEIPAALASSIKRSIRTEIGREQSAWLPIAPDIREWLQMKVMPYGVGVLASVLIGVSFLSMLYSGIGSPVPFSMAARPNTSVELASNRDPYRELVSNDISAAAFARSRTGVANESPSINPQGALIALTRSLIRGGMKDDEVVVVADVFGNGLAQIAEVVEPSRDRRAVAELQKALGSDPSYAAFVPSEMENRPESVRVILKFQSVDVSTKAPVRRPRR